MGNDAQAELIAGCNSYRMRCGTEQAIALVMCGLGFGIDEIGRLSGVDAKTVKQIRIHRSDVIMGLRDDPALARSILLRFQLDLLSVKGLTATLACDNNPTKLRQAATVARMICDINKPRRAPGRPPKEKPDTPPEPAPVEAIPARPVAKPVAKQAD